MAVYVSPIAPGLGDLVVCLPVIQSLIARGEETFLVIRSPLQEGLPARIRGLAGTINEPDFLKLQLGRSDRYINMREHALQTEALWGSPEFQARYPGLNVDGVVRRISADFGVSPVDGPGAPLDFDRRDEVRDHVLFLPGTSGIFKEWPAGRWLELWRELAAVGIPSAMLGQPHRSAIVARLRDAGLPWISDASLAEAIDLVSSARVVVAVDTGLMHISVHQGVPTVALFRSGGFFHRALPAALPVFAPACPAPCTAEEFRSQHHAFTAYPDWGEENWLASTHQWQCRAPGVDRCMAQISAAQVLALVHKALRSTIT